MKLGRDIGPAIVERARDLAPRGQLLNAPGPDLRCMPALNVTKAETDEMLALISSVIAEMT